MNSSNSFYLICTKCGEFPRIIDYKNQKFKCERCNNDTNDAFAWIKGSISIPAWVKETLESEK